MGRRSRRKVGNQHQRQQRHRQRAHGSAVYQRSIRECSSATCSSTGTSSKPSARAQSHRYYAPAYQHSASTSDGTAILWAWICGLWHVVYGSGICLVRSGLLRPDVAERSISYAIKSPSRFSRSTTELFTVQQSIRAISCHITSSCIIIREPRSTSSVVRTGGQSRTTLYEFRCQAGPNAKRTVSIPRASTAT